MEREERHVVREEPTDPVEPGAPSRPGPIREESHYVSDVAPVAETEVVTRWSPARRAHDLIYLVFAVIDIIILFRILLKVLAANPATPFTAFVYGLSDFFLAPFHGLLPAMVSGRSVFELSAVFGLLAYALLGYVLAWLFAIIFMREVTVAKHARSPYRPRSG